MINIIGCGGAGAWVAEAMARLAKPPNITLIDGDTIEARNLDRQLFTLRDIGRNKASALASRIGCRFNEEFYHAGSIEHTESDWIIVCADNNPARASALQAADLYRCNVISCANEKLSAEAYIYRPAWKGTGADPRSYYPDIMSDRTGDPSSIRMGCTGEAAEAAPQLVTANLMAAALAGHLYVLWGISANGLDKEAKESLPIRIRQNMTSSEMLKYSDAVKQQ